MFTICSLAFAAERPSPSPTADPDVTIALFPVNKCKLLSLVRHAQGFHNQAKANAERFGPVSTHSSSQCHPRPSAAAHSATAPLAAIFSLPLSPAASLPLRLAAPVSRCLCLGASHASLLFSRYLCLGASHALLIFSRYLCLAAFHVSLPLSLALTHCLLNVRDETHDPPHAVLYENTTGKLYWDAELTKKGRKQVHLLNLISNLSLLCSLSTLLSLSTLCCL